MNRGSSIPGVRKKSLAKRMWKFKDYYIMLLPALVYIIIFCYGPMYGLQIAFKDYKAVLGFGGSRWVGMKHFMSFFNGYNFWTLMRNTFSISIYSLIAGFPIPILLALTLNEIRNERYKKTLQTILYAPHFISTVVLVGIMNTMFSPSIGVVNTVREMMGMERVYFTSLPSTFIHMYVWSGVWQGMGWSAVIYISALASVDPALHEAATIDGASRLQRVRYINFPTIQPTVTILLIMQVGRLASVGYEKIYLMQNDLNVGVSEVISTYVYKRGIQNTNYSFSTAVGVFNNVINVLLLVCANAISSKVSQTSLF